MPAKTAIVPSLLRAKNPPRHAAGNETVNSSRDLKGPYPSARGVAPLISGEMPVPNGDRSGAYSSKVIVRAIFLFL